LPENSHAALARVTGKSEHRNLAGNWAPFSGRFHYELLEFYPLLFTRINSQTCNFRYQFIHGKLHLFIR
ncbi:hypothetical protein PENTCL1PPCAC_6211, partial [Pristionchus entomophagus]